MKKTIEKLASEISVMRNHLHHLATSASSLHEAELVQYSQLLDEKLNTYNRLLRKLKLSSEHFAKRISS